MRKPSQENSGMDHCGLRVHEAVNFNTNSNLQPMPKKPISPNQFGHCTERSGQVDSFGQLSESTSRQLLDNSPKLVLPLSEAKPAQSCAVVDGLKDLQTLLNY